MKKEKEKNLREKRNGYLVIEQKEDAALEISDQPDRRTAAKSRRRRAQNLKKAGILSFGALTGAMAFHIASIEGLVQEPASSVIYEQKQVGDTNLQFSRILDLEEADSGVSGQLDEIQEVAASVNSDLQNQSLMQTPDLSEAIARKIESDPSSMNEKKIENTIDVVLDDKTEYHGEYEKNLIHGKGKMLFPNKDQYSGVFQKGVRKGSGKYTWKNKDYYDGSWDKDKMSGEGTYHFNKSGNIYKGTFEDNKFVSGKAYYERNNNYTVRIENGVATRMTSTFKNGMRIETDLDHGEVTGQAKITWPTGAKYEGYIENGLREGEGELVYSNGARYVGTFVKDKFEGYCTYYYSDGKSSLAGNFTNGKPNGQLTYTNKNGESFTTDWQNGKCVKIYE